MVTPTYGTATFQGASKTYQVDLYIADVIGTQVKFDSGSGASTASLPFWRAPENVILTDLSIATGPTVITAVVPVVNGATIGGIRFRIANFLNTLAFRPQPRLAIGVGSNFGLTEA